MEVLKVSFLERKGSNRETLCPPMLFVISMEYFSRVLIVKLPATFKYHKGCKEVKVNHLCFAYGLFMFSHGDFESVKSLGDALKHFTAVSGLQVNKKSVLFISLECRTS